MPYSETAGAEEAALEEAAAEDADEALCFLVSVKMAKITHRAAAAAAIEPPQIVRTAQKGTYVGKHEVLSGEAARQRCLSSFELDALMVVEVDIPVNHLVCLRKRGRFVPVNALCLED